MRRSGPACDTSVIGREDVRKTRRSAFGVANLN